MKEYKVLAINPGSTSTKIALFAGETCLFSKNISHDAAKLAEFKSIGDQYEYRRDMILEAINAAGFTLEGVDAFSGRGGGTTSVVGGIYTVNEQMMDDCRSGQYVRHPANLGCQLAEAFRKQYGGQAFVVNPPDTDELQDLARLTGLKGVYRESKLHALNQKEIGIRYAHHSGRKYEELNLVIAHIGGGVSVTAHRQGRMVDTNDIANGDGPFAPTRCGQLPAQAVIDLCFSGKFTQRELSDKVIKSGGFVDHLGTADAREIRQKIDAGDKYAKLVYDAFIYQIGKAIGSATAILHGKVDAVILTGGIANDSYMTDQLKQMCGYVGPIEIMPGEFELEALTSGAIRVLNGEERAKAYTGKPVWQGFLI